jgi:VWFA-related protein
VRSRLALALWLVLSLGGAAAAAQEQELEVSQAEDGQPTGTPVGGLAFVDEVEVTVVNVIAYVTDKDGTHVEDLTREDFRLFQDGEERPISNFQMYTKELIRSHFQSQEPSVLAVPPTTEEAEEGDPGLTEIQPVWMMIFVDNDNLLPLDRNRAINQARDFIRGNVQEPVRMMVAENNRRLKVVQEFTTESDEILGALRSLKMHTGGRTSRDSSRSDFYDELDRYKEGQGTAVNESFNRARSLAFSFAEEEQNGLQFTLGAIREAVNMMSGLPGKKMILYLSNGLPMIPGIDLFYAMANAYSDPGMITEGTRYNQSRQFDSIVKNANAQGVTFYTIDAGGLENVSMGSAQYHGPRDTTAVAMGRSNYLDTLRMLAEDTGGVAIFNTNDVGPRLVSIEQDFYSYYSIGYNLQSSGADRVHRIKLTLPNHPEYDVRYRRRIVEKSLESRVQDRVLTGLVIPLEDNPLDIAITTGNPAPASEKRWTVPFELTFPLDRIALFPMGEDYVGRVTFFLAARDNDGKQSDLVRQEHEVRVAADSYEEALRRRFAITASLLMEAGSYRISTGLLDQFTRQTGYQVSSVHVGE